MAPSPLVVGLKESQNQDFEPGFKEDEKVSIQKFSKVMSKLSCGLFATALSAGTLGENRYQVLGLISQEKFGTAYLASLPEKKMFRIMIPSAGKLTSKQHYDQFCKDCKAAQSLQHPNIQTPIEFGNWDESRFYYSVSYIGPSPSLTTVTKKAHGQNSMSLKNFYSIGHQIIDSMSYAHSKNVWHRHLSPDNIWVLNGDTKCSISIGDFGFTFDGRYQFELLQKVDKANTFMAPETINNDETYIDNRSDIYSIGRILKLLLKVSEKPEVDIVDQIQKLVAKSTESRRSDRFQSVSELKTAWESAVGQPS